MLDLKLCRNYSVSLFVFLGLFTAPFLSHAQTFEAKKVIKSEDKLAKEKFLATDRKKIEPADQNKIEPSDRFKMIRKLENDLSAQKQNRLDANRDLLKKELPRTRVIGGDVSGGGTTIVTSAGRKLLDVYDFIDTSSSGITNEQLPSDKWIRLDLAGSVIYRRLAAAIDRIGSVSPKFAQSIALVAKNFPIYIVKGQFQFLSPTFEPWAGLSAAAQKDYATTALYIRDIGVVISRQEFVEMSSAQQTALILHELIRMLQIQFQLQLTHGELQTIVSSVFNARADLAQAFSNTALRSFLPSEKLHPLFLNAQTIEIALVKKFGAELAENLDRIQSSDQLSLADLADHMTSLSSKAFRYRATRVLPIEDERYLRDRELELDRDANKLRSQALNQFVGDTYGPVSDLVANLNHEPAEKQILKCMNQSIFVSTPCEKMHKLFNALVR